MSQTRPVLRYHGGKWRLAPWIISMFPPHRIYVEPYGGAASVLLRKQRSYAEIYNDLDDGVVGLFRVLRGDRAAEFIDAVRLTPFARAEFEDSYLATDDPVERARRLLVRSFMGFGSDGHNVAVRTGFRANSAKAHTHPAVDWSRMPDVIEATRLRFAGVVIENRPALDVMSQHDGPDTLHYLDPPYMPDTRSDKSRKTGERYHAYVHEMTADDHAGMLGFLGVLGGMVVLSGYDSPIYGRALAGWRRVTRLARADGGLARQEVLWINPAAADALGRTLSFMEEAHAP